MIDHLRRVLEQAVNDPEMRVREFSVLSAEERQQILTEWNETKVERASSQIVHELFEKQVEKTPESIAVVFGKDELTYDELNVRANQLAHYLREVGVGPEVQVGVCVEPSVDMIIAIMGILKAGGSYVPLDPSYPSERLGYMVDDAGIRIVLTEEELRGGLSATGAEMMCLDGDRDKIVCQSGANLATTVSGNNLAYVIYTSGSTGRPKGVGITHRSVCNLAAAQISLFGLQAGVRVLQFASISFDASVWEWIMALLSGGELRLGSRAAMLSEGCCLEIWSVKAFSSHITTIDFIGIAGG